MPAQRDHFGAIIVGGYAGLSPVGQRRSMASLQYAPIAPHALGTPEILRAHSSGASFSLAHAASARNLCRQIRLARKTLRACSSRAIESGLAANETEVSSVVAMARLARAVSDAFSVRHRLGDSGSVRAENRQCENKSARGEP
jgi:hypothetical protein